MLIIDAVRRAFRGASAEPGRAASPWPMLVAAVVFCVILLGAILLIKGL